jgi:unsaturated chondroitin disaccharide hydrolase
MMNQPQIDEAALRGRIEQTFGFGVSQLAGMLERWPVEKPAPIYTANDVWTRPDFIWTDWCPGFYAGMMWLAHERTGEACWREAAEAYTRKLEHRKFDRDVHDLGFIFMSTANRWHNLLAEGDPVKQWLADLLVTAGTVQSFRWKSTGEDHYVYSFNGPQSLFIDVMMNIRILFRAHQLGGSEELYRRAVTHARTTEKFLVRKAGPRLVDGDGKVIHEGIFNPERGEFRNLSSQQGYSPFTCWARGLAWAMYGFTDTWLFTQDPLFLETAERCAGFYLAHTPAHGVPYWDFGAPHIPNEPFDSSAAAIAAGAFWKLKDIAETRRGRETYRHAALTILNTLTSDEFSNDPSQAGILRHGVYHKPLGWGVDAAVMWGDYFFMETLHAVLAE